MGLCPSTDRAMTSFNEGSVPRRRKLSHIRPKQDQLPGALMNLASSADLIRQGTNADIYRSRSTKEGGDEEFCVRAFGLRKIRTPHMRDFSFLEAIVPPISLAPGGRARPSRWRTYEGGPMNTHPGRVYDRASLVRAIARCDGLVKMHGYAENDNYFCVVCDLLDGETVTDRVDDDDTWDELKSAALFRAILETVASLHEGNIVHRCLASSKWMYVAEDSDQLRLSDIAAAVQLAPDQKVYREAEQASDKHVVGNQYIHAPEILTRREWSKASDMWALGVLLYEILNGCMPFFGRKKADLQKAIKAAKVDIPDSEMSQGAKDLVLSLLAKNPEQRLTAAQALNHRWIMDPVREVEAWRSVDPKTRTVPAGRRSVMQTRKSLASPSTATRSAVSPPKVTPMLNADSRTASAL